MREWKRILCGGGLLAMAAGLLVMLVGLVVRGVRHDQPGGAVLLAVVFNGLLAALFGAIALLNSRRWPSWPTRRIVGESIEPAPTLAGWLLLGCTANCIAGIAVYSGPAGASIWRSPAFMGICVGVPFFMIGSLVLRLCGVPVWRKDEKGPGSPSVTR